MINEFERDLIREKLSRVMYLRKLIADEMEHASIIKFSFDSWKSITVYKLESFNKVVEAYGVEPSDITTEVVSGGHIKRSTNINGYVIDVYALKGSDEYEQIKGALVI